MKKTRNFKERLIAGLIVFMMMFNNAGLLTSGLIALAADSSDDVLTYSAEFVVINNVEEVDSENHEIEEINEQSIQENFTEDSEIVDENSEVSTETVISEEVSEESAEEEGMSTEENIIKEENQIETEIENEQESELKNEEDIPSETEETEETEEFEETEETDETEEIANQEDDEEVVEEQNLPDGLALQITLGLKNKGYLKNAKIDIKDLANQHFKLKDNIVLSEYVQSIEENKIRFKQINGGTEATIYIPIELKEEEQVDIAKLQSGVELSLTCTNVTEEGEEEILTRSVRPVLDISNDMDLIVESEAEKFIPYIIEGRREALVQLRVSLGTTTNNNLPIKDTELEIPLPQIEGATIKDVNVQSLSTGFTNGKLNGDVIFTGENWSFQEGKVQINVNNPENSGRYQMNNGDDTYIISYIYENIPEEFNNVETTINAIANIFTAVGEKQITTSLEKEYDLSHANSNIVTYNVLRRTKEISKGYLYANANAKETEYVVEYDNSIDINVSRPDLVRAIQINEQEEYFVIDENNKYPTRTEAGENTYYERIRLNKQNLNSIIGEEGNLEILLENGTSLITIDKNTEDDGDGNITISFGENKIGRIIIKINNPEGEGILSLVATKAIAEVNFEKIDFSLFKSIEEEFIGLAEIEEGLVTELGNQKIETELKETSTNAQISLSRSDISTLVENEDVGITIALNNSSEKSDMYKNPVFEVVFPSEVEEITLKDMNLLYGNEELEIANTEIIRNELNQVVLRVSLAGTQTKYAMGDQAIGTTIILKVDIKTNIYSASKQEEIEMNYYNEDATKYEEQDEEWKMMQEGSSYKLIASQGKSNTKINIVAPEGFANIQVISNYKEGAEITSINKSLMEDTIETYADAKQAEMRMVLINNTDEELKDVSILGRTMFSGNKSIINGEDLGTNAVAPMTSNILGENVAFTQSIYYSENGEATSDLENPENGWTQEVEDYKNIQSYLIVINEPIKIGDVLGYSYIFEIPEQLGNNIDIVGTYATTYTGTKTKGTIETEKLKLTTGDAPQLKVETFLDEENVSENDVINCRVKVTNEGRSISTNTHVNSLIPAGTTYIQDGKLDSEIRQVPIELGDIRPGTTEESTYQVQVNTEETAEDEIPEGIIKATNNVEADGLSEPIYTESPITEVEEPEINIDISEKSSGQIIGAGKSLEYNINIYNPGETAYDDCTVKVVLPEGLSFEDGYSIPPISDDNAEVISAVYNAQTREVTWNIGTLSEASLLVLDATSELIEESEKELVTYATISSPNLKRDYDSNQIRNTLAKTVIEYSFETNNNNQFIKEGDNIQYILNIQNVGLLYNEAIVLSSSIPENYEVTSVSVIKENSSNYVEPSQNLGLTVPLDSGESAQVLIDCKVNELSADANNILTQNNWTISGKGINTITTPKIKNIVQQNYDIQSAESEEETQYYLLPAEVAELEQDENTSENQYQPLEVNEKVEETKEERGQFKVMGRAFNDLNNNGEFDEDEEGMANITAKLCNSRTQEIVAQTSTNNIGEYLFDGILPGEYYVKFEYDNTKYTLSEYKKKGVTADKKSDAIISNYRAVTDKIVVTDKSISDINIGLVRSGIFDLDLDVNINQMTVQNNSETINYEMENSKLAKVDIDPKTVTESTVYVRYNLTITNKGEIEGYAKRIVDYIPEGLDFDSTLNPTWYQGTNGNIYTDELQDTLLQPGENRTITLVLTKQMKEDNTGLINNIFEIDKSYNDYAIEDIDSMAGNRAEGEDDMSNADVIIGIQTGGNVINVMLISATLITLLIALYAIKVFNDRRSKEVIL